MAVNDANKKFIFDEEEVRSDVEAYLATPSTVLRGKGS